MSALAKPVIQVSAVGKQYTPLTSRPSLRHEADQLIQRAMGKASPVNWEKPPFWALRQVSFTVTAGESVALIGRNGAGKTTLLRILANITAPSTGDVVVTGRCVGLISLGAGFRGALTGRDNLFLSAAIYGVSPLELRPLLPYILEFAELGDFIYQPIKSYSSGMLARLGFSLAVHILPEIILLDEILAVGDAAFREKCWAKLDALRAEGRTLILVAHDEGAVLRLCDRALWLHNGELRADGAIEDVLAEYQSS